jgi:hypothetical protein
MGSGTATETSAGEAHGSSQILKGCCPQCRWWTGTTSTRGQPCETALRTSIPESGDARRNRNPRARAAGTCNRIALRDDKSGISVKRW